MRHTASLERRILEIPSLIENALAQSNRLQEKYRQFAVTSVNDNDTHALVNEIIGMSRLSSVGVQAEAHTRTVNNMNKLYDMIRVEMAQKGKNAWGLHSGVTRFTTHEKSAPKRDNGRIESMMVGANYKTNIKSLDFVSELVGV